MANFNFDLFKKKAAEKAGELAGKSVAALNTAADKATTVAKKAKLNAEIASEKEQMKKNYMVLGQLYFEKYGENADPDFASIIAGINSSVSAIDEKREKIAALDADNDEGSATEDVEGECCCHRDGEDEEGKCCCHHKDEDEEGEHCCRRDGEGEEGECCHKHHHEDGHCCRKDGETEETESSDTAQQ